MEAKSICVEVKGETEGSVAAGGEEEKRYMWRWRQLRVKGRASCGREGTVEG